MDMTVTVIILPEAGWESYNWAGPVFNEEGNTAQVKMTSSLTVVATMKRTDTKWRLRVGNKAVGVIKKAKKKAQPKVVQSANSKF